MSKYALITGAGQGIGRAVATDLSRNGFSVIATGRDQEKLTRVLKELSGSGHHAVEADLSTVGAIEEFVSKIRKIIAKDGLCVFVHCAAQTPDPQGEAKLESSSVETMNGHMSVTALSGPILLKLLKRHLAKPPRSHAILLSSDWVIDGIIGPPVFSAAKSFATTVWRHARKEYLSEGIILCSIIAGNVASYDVDWTNAKWTIDDPIQDVKAELGISRISLSDIAAAVRFVIGAPFAAVTEIRIVPLDPEYVP